MGALMANDGGSWLQAWPGPGTQAAPSGRKSPWAPGGLGPPLPEKPFLLFSSVRPSSKPGQTTWPQVCVPEYGPGPRCTDQD